MLHGLEQVMNHEGTGLVAAKDKIRPLVILNDSSHTVRIRIGTQDEVSSTQLGLSYSNLKCACSSGLGDVTVEKSASGSSCSGTTSTC